MIGCENRELSKKRTFALSLCGSWDGRILRLHSHERRSGSLLWLGLGFSLTDRSGWLAWLRLLFEFSLQIGGGSHDSRPTSPRQGARRRQLSPLPFSRRQLFNDQTATTSMAAADIARRLSFGAGHQEFSMQNYIQYDARAHRFRGLFRVLNLVRSLENWESEIPEYLKRDAGRSDTNYRVEILKLKVVLFYSPYSIA